MSDEKRELSPLVQAWAREQFLQDGKRLLPDAPITGGLYGSMGEEGFIILRSRTADSKVELWYEEEDLAEMLNSLAAHAAGAAAEQVILLGLK